MSVSSSIHKFDELINYINEKLHFDCREYNQSYIKRRLNARILACGLKPDDYANYYQILTNNTSELRKLYDALTINVTQFFRDNPTWNYLRHNLIPTLVSENKSTGRNFIKVWSCGCSSGEEPYSLAILFNEIAIPQNFSVTIYATDIDDISLEKAKKATYNFSSLMSTPKEYLVKYFHQTQNTEGKNNTLSYELDKKIVSMVKFSKNNFFRDPPPDKDIDMVVCRNVIIYFTPEAKDKLMEIIYNSLKENGWLIIGKSEILFTNKSQKRFYLYNSEERVYRKERRISPQKIILDKRQNWWYGYDTPDGKTPQVGGGGGGR